MHGSVTISISMLHNKALLANINKERYVTTISLVGLLAMTAAILRIACVFRMALVCCAASDICLYRCMSLQLLD